MAGIAAFAAWLAAIQGARTLTQHFALVFGPLALCLFATTYLAARGRTRPSGALFFGLLALLSGAVAYLDSRGPLFATSVVSLLAIFTSMPVLLGLGLAWIRSPAIQPGARRSAVRWLALPLSFVPLGLFLSNAPLRLGFVVSRPALERLADRVEAGQPVVGPVRAGIHTIVSSVRNTANRNVALLITTGVNRGGFVRLDPKPSLADDGPLVNLSVDVDLGGGWHFREED